MSQTPRQPPKEPRYLTLAERMTGGRKIRFLLGVAVLAVAALGQGARIYDTLSETSASAGEPTPTGAYEQAVQFPADQPERRA